MDSETFRIDVLSKQDADIISNNGQLEETHFQLFNNILRKYTTYFIQPPSFWSTPDCIVPAKQNVDCIQILYAPGHWVCCYYDMRKVFIYDSLNRNRLSNEERTYLSHLFPEFDLIDIQFPGVQKQKNSIDCGIYALAFAVSIIYRIKPEKVQYDQMLMRKHLLQMFSSSQIRHFPQNIDYSQQNVIPLALATQRRYQMIQHIIKRKCTKKMIMTNKPKKEKKIAPRTNLLIHSSIGDCVSVSESVQNVTYADKVKESLATLHHDVIKEDELYQEIDIKEESIINIETQLDFIAYEQLQQLKQEVPDLNVKQPSDVPHLTIEKHDTENVFVKPDCAQTNAIEIKGEFPEYSDGTANNHNEFEFVDVNQLVNSQIYNVDPLNVSGENIYVVQQSEDFIIR